MVGSRALTPATKSNLGRHEYYLTEGSLLLSSKWESLAHMFRIICVAVLKLAVVFFLARLMSQIKNSGVGPSYISVVCFGIFSLLTILLLVQCHRPAPISSSVSRI